MNIITRIKGILGSSAAHATIAVATSGLSVAVAEAATAGNPIGDAAIAAAKAVEVPGKTGAEKKAAVIEAIKPVIVEAATKAGRTALAAEVEAFAGLVVEEVVAGMKATPLGMLASALLTAFGVTAR
jgi:hypothetical protein